MPAVRHPVRRSAASAVLLQQSVRRLSDVSRVRQHHRARHGSGGAGFEQIDSGRRHRAVDQTALSSAARGAEARRAASQDPSRRALVSALREREALRRRGRGRPSDELRVVSRCAEGRLRGDPRILPVARAEEVQSPRPRVPEPVSGLPDVPGLRRRAAAA